jgi:hypothetical protein
MTTKRKRKRKARPARGAKMELRPQMLSFRDALKYGGFGKQKAYDLIRAGKIDARKMGRRTMVDRRSIDRYHKSLPKLIDDAVPA